MSTTIPTSAERAEHKANTKRLDKLERGDWIHADFEDFIDVARVVHVETYPSDSYGVGAILLYRSAGETAVHTQRFAAADPVRLLTDDEIGEALEDERRQEIARQLADLAGLVRTRLVPLPARRVTVNYPLGENLAAVDAVAELLGEQVIRYGQMASVIQEGCDDYGPSIVVDWSARHPEPKPASAADVVPVPAEDATITPGYEVEERTEEQHLISAERRQALQWKRDVTQYGEDVALERVHAEALAEDNDRAKAAIIGGLRDGEWDRVTNPNMARFLAQREDARRAEAAPIAMCPTCGQPHDHVHTCAGCGQGEMDDGKPFVPCCDVPAENEERTEEQEPGPVVHVSHIGNETLCGLLVEVLPAGHTSVHTWAEPHNCPACTSKVVPF